MQMDKKNSTHNALLLEVTLWAIYIPSAQMAQQARSAILALFCLIVSLLLSKVLAKEPERFKTLVHESLVRHVAAINKMADAGK